MKPFLALLGVLFLSSAEVSLAGGHSSLLPASARSRNEAPASTKEFGLYRVTVGSTIYNVIFGTGGGTLISGPHSAKKCKELLPASDRSYYCAEYVRLKVKKVASR